MLRFRHLKRFGCALAHASYASDGCQKIALQRTQNEFPKVCAIAHVGLDKHVVFDFRLSQLAAALPEIGQAKSTRSYFPLPAWSPALPREGSC